MTEVSIETLDIREKLAHIDLMLAQHTKEHVHVDLMQAQQDRVRQETRLAPMALVVSAMTAGAAFFAAAFTLAKVLM